MESCWSSRQKTVTAHHWLASCWKVRRNYEMALKVKKQNKTVLLQSHLDIPEKWIIFISNTVHRLQIAIQYMCTNNCASIQVLLRTESYWWMIATRFLIGLYLNFCYLIDCNTKQCWIELNKYSLSTWLVAGNTKTFTEFNLVIKKDL